MIAQILLDEKSCGYSNGLYHYTQIKLAYNSNHIEGNALTEEQTRYIYETKTVIPASNEALRVDDIIEAVNHFRVFDYVLKSYDEPLTEEYIKTLHKMLLQNTSSENYAWFKVGDYKLKPNTIGSNFEDIKTASPKSVPAKMVKLIGDYSNTNCIDFEDIIDFHYKFESIHPFQDGNGRVGRLIMFKECLRNDIVPFIIDERKKAFYYRGLKEYPNDPCYLTDTCLSCQDTYRSALQYFGYDDESRDNGQANNGRK